MELQVRQFQMKIMMMLKLVIVFDRYNFKKLSSLDFPDHDIMKIVTASSNSKLILVNSLSVVCKHVLTY